MLYTAVYSTVMCARVPAVLPRLKLYTVYCTCKFVQYILGKQKLHTGMLSVFFAFRYAAPLRIPKTDIIHRRSILQRYVRMLHNMTFPKMVLAPSQTQWFRINPSRKKGPKTRAGSFFCARGVAHRNDLMKSKFN